MIGYIPYEIFQNDFVELISVSKEGVPMGPVYACTHSFHYNQEKEVNHLLATDSKDKTQRTEQRATSNINFHQYIMIIHHNVDDPETTCFLSAV